MKYADKLRDLQKVLGREPLSVKRYSQVGKVLLDVYVNGFYPQKHHHNSWESPPNPDAHAVNLASWYFEPQNQHQSHFRQAREHVLEHMTAAVKKHFPDCGEKQFEHIKNKTLQYFYVDDIERFQALLVLGATQKKIEREFSADLAEKILKRTDNAQKKSGKGNWIN